MSLLRRAIGRKEFLLALLVLMAAGGWCGWYLLVRPAAAGTQPLAAQVDQLRGMLDAGQYAEAVAYADGQLADQVSADQLGLSEGLQGDPPDQAAILKYKAIAQMLTADGEGAAATADEALTAGASGADAAVVLAVKALVSLEEEETDIARLLAQQALSHASTDLGEAGLMARVVYAAVNRAEYDLPSEPNAAGLNVQAIQQSLRPIYAAMTVEPSSAWQARFWRRGLALLVDAGILASLAGDPAGEVESLDLMRRLCPQDAWDCYFHIPDKARAAAQVGSLDDHSRAAMMTAAGFLYLVSGDRFYCDTLFRRAIIVYGRLLETYDGWEGDRMDTWTPGGIIKTVGQEYYTYRNRMDRLAKYSADWWGIRVLDGRSTLAEALSQCDHKMFRSIVRVRADRDVDPIVIVQQEQLREDFYGTVADWFLKRPHAPQVEWELARGQILAQIGQEEAKAVDAIAQARRLAHQRQYGEALALLAEGLLAEPSLAETGVAFRCEIASVLMAQRRFGEAVTMLDDADLILQTGDERLAHRGTAGLRGRIRYYRMQCAAGSRNLVEAAALAEQLIADSELSLNLRGRTLLDLVEVHIVAGDRAGALDAYRRLRPANPEQAQAYQVFLQVAASRLDRKGW